ncbi:MAG: SLC13/DASS family transporter [Bacteroidaceae bacterium]|nr:SLC13/DASS family transporter [Bacteroidaceae bacterium]
MFKIFTGFHLLDAYHRERHARRTHPNKLLKKLAFSAVILLVTLWLWNAPSAMFGIAGLTIVQQRVIAIFAFATLMWVFEVVPSWATSVAIIGLLLLFTSDSGLLPFQTVATDAQLGSDLLSGGAAAAGAAAAAAAGGPLGQGITVATMADQPVGTLLSYKDIMATFADPVIMLFIGGFILAIAATKTGLDAQLARILLKPFGRKSDNVLLGFILITGIFSMFVSNTATAAMMLTFLTPVFKQLPPEGKGRIALTLSIPLAANLGGMGTPIGTPPNAIALKYLNDPAGLNLNLGFGEWMSFMLPFVIVMLLVSWLVLKIVFPFTQKTIDIKIEGEMKRGFKTNVVIVTFIITVLLWIFDKATGMNSYTVALIPFVVFALTGVITKDDLDEINWSVIWMVAGGFALGYALNKSGLADNAVKSIPFGSFSPIVILLISGLVCYGLSNFISNSATAALLMPILATVCIGMGDKLAPIGGTPTVLIGIAIAASSAMVLPISTPPNALAYSTNLVQQKDMAKIGLLVGIVSLVIGYGMLFVLGEAGML